MTSPGARLSGVGLLLAASLSTSGAFGVELSVTPLLGAEAPAEHGWQPFAVRLRAGATPERGVVALVDGSEASTRAPFAIAPGEQVTLELYAHDELGRSLEAVARDASGAVLTRMPVSSLRSETPLLVDLGRTARLETALRGEHVAVHRLARPWASTTGLELTVTRPLVDARSGEPVLPERGLGYGSATVVLVASDVLLALPEKKVAALVDWVYTGGDLAVTLDDPQALANPRLATLFGGPSSLEPAAELGSHADFEIDDPDSSPALPSHYKTRHAAPSDAVLAKLSRVTGEGLTPTRFGSSRAAGLGRVHALAFDPAGVAFIDDPWVRRSIVDLVGDAWDRRALLALAGDASFDQVRTDSVRKLLDPNEGSRWSIWFSAIVLVVYALLAGPLSFRRAAKRGTPLRAFVELPMWSFGAAALIVLVGAFAKGGRSRARRLSFIECGEGTRRAASVHFRALFASSADSLRVAAGSPSSLLDVAGAGSEVTRSLVLGRETAELVDLHGRPWETVLVREDGLDDLSGAVTFTGTGGDLAVENGFAKALLGVVVHAPGSSGELRYIPRIRHGERVRFDAGKVLATPPAAVPGPLVSTAPTPRRLDSYRFGSVVDADDKGASAAWSALEYAGRDAADWWPDERPALIAELEGGDGIAVDSELAVDYDRVFVRVVGEPR